MAEASRKQGQSGENLLQLLERRMDNAVYRSGLAVSRRAARQLVTHGHFHLNGRRVDIPSIRMKEGDVLVLRDGSKKNEYFKHIDDVSPASPDTVPTWMKVNRKKFEITITGIPARDDAEPEINEQLIVEYYSR
jgi:small subunit ribosomal protein S4